MLTFEIIDFEIGGNAEDGYYIDRVSPTGEYIDLTEREFADYNLLTQMLSDKVIARAASELKLDSDGYDIFVNEVSTGKPLFDLQRVERERDS